MLLNKQISSLDLATQGDSSKVIQIYTAINSGNVGDSTGTLIAAEFSAVDNFSNNRTIAVKAEGDIQVVNGDVELKNGTVIFPDGSTMSSFAIVWNSIANYVINDPVSYGGSIYICTQANTNKQPDTNPSYWTLAGAQATIPAASGTYVNEKFETGVTGWVSSTGFDISSQSSAVLSGSRSGLLAKDALNRAGATIYYPFTIENMDKQSVMQITFAYRADSTYLTAGDFGLSIYDVTNGDTILPTINTLPTGTGQFLSTFISSNSTSYRLLFNVNTTSASAENFFIDNVIVADFPAIYGSPWQASPISGWTAFTLAMGATVTPPVPKADAIIKSSWRRVGGNMELSIALYQSGAGIATGSGTYLISLPTGYTIDTTNYSLDNLSNYNGSAVGHGSIEVASNVGILSIHPYSSTQLCAIIVYSSAPTSGIYSYWDSSHFNFAAQLSFEFTCSVAISQWTTNVNLNGDFTEYAWNSSTSATNDTTSFGYGSQGVLIQSFAPGAFGIVTKRAEFQKPIQATDLIILEIYDGVSWGVVPHGGVATRGPIMNTDIYGVYFNTIDSTHIDVVFQNKANEGNSAWSSFTTYKWRVRKTSQGNFAEQVTTTSLSPRDATSRVVLNSTAPPSTGNYSAAIQVTGNYGVPAGTKAIIASVSAMLYNNSSPVVNLFQIAFTDSITSGTPTTFTGHPCYINDFYANAGSSNMGNRGSDEMIIPLNGAGQFYMFSISNSQNPAAGIFLTIKGYYVGGGIQT